MHYTRKTPRQASVIPETLSFVMKAAAQHPIPALAQAAVCARCEALGMEVGARSPIASAPLFRVAAMGSQLLVDRAMTAKVVR